MLAYLSCKSPYSSLSKQLALLARHRFGTRNLLIATTFIPAVQSLQPASWPLCVVNKGLVIDPNPLGYTLGTTESVVFLYLMTQQKSYGARGGSLG
jgi:hypothetical protein